MREIKYRGKRIDNGQWIYGYLVKQFGEFKIYDDSKEDFGQWLFDVDPETLGQYTGLEDINGKEIYTGDICKVTSTEYYSNEYFAIDENWKMIMYVDFSNFVYKLRETSDKWCSIFLCETEGMDIEVIDSIYEHPEMMEEL